MGALGQNIDDLDNPQATEALQLLKALQSPLTLNEYDEEDDPFVRGFIQRIKDEADTTELAKAYLRSLSGV
jgi:hypothetical protein